VAQKIYAVEFGGSGIRRIGDIVPTFLLQSLSGEKN
jgi:hypothetical protein